MKKYSFVCLVLGFLMIVVCAIAAPAQAFDIEYVTGAEGLWNGCTNGPDSCAYNGNGIVVFVYNNSENIQDGEIVIYKNTGARGQLVSEHQFSIPPNHNAGLAYTIDFEAGSGNYWVAIRASSDLLVPTVTFEHWVEEEGPGMFLPFVHYKNGDFAVFKLKKSGKRVRIR